MRKNIDINLLYEMSGQNDKEFSCHFVYAKMYTFDIDRRRQKTPASTAEYM